MTYHNIWSRVVTIFEKLGFKSEKKHVYLLSNIGKFGKQRLKLLYESLCSGFQIWISISWGNFFVFFLKISEKIKSLSRTNDFLAIRKKLEDSWRIFYSSKKHFRYKISVPCVPERAGGGCSSLLSSQVSFSTCCGRRRAPRVILFPTRRAHVRRLARRSRALVPLRLCSARKGGRAGDLPPARRAAVARRPPGAAAFRRRLSHASHRSSSLLDLKHTHTQYTT